MATITNNSPIETTGGTLYINSTDFESKLFFTATASTYYYVIVRDGYVIANGILQGHSNGTNYDYRFDFDNYIKIENQKDIVLTNIDLSGCMTFNSKLSSTITLCIDTTDIVAQNITAGHFTTLANGQIMLVGGHTTSQIVCDDRFEYKFIDKEDSTPYKFETVITKSQNTFISITIYEGYTLGYSLQYVVNGNGTELSSAELPVAAGYDSRTFLINTSQPANKFNWGIYNDNTEQTLISDSWDLTSPTCFNRWYFYNPNGSFDTLNTVGNMNQISTITKNTIRVGNNIINTDITNTKQIKQNSGFGLTESQINGLIYSPYVYALEGVDNYINPNLLQGTLLPGFETSFGTVTEMPPIGEEAYMQFVPSGSGFGLNGFPFTYYQGFKYYMSMYLRSNVDIQMRFQIDVMGQKIFDLVAHEWQLCTFPIDSDGTYINSILYLVSNETCTLDFKKLKLEYGIQASEWSPSVYDSPATTKEYIINTNTFEGYNGKKLSQKNIELIFTDPKIYKRKTNKTINFFD